MVDRGPGSSARRLAGDRADGARVPRDRVATLAAGERDEPERHRRSASRSARPSTLIAFGGPERDARPGVSALPAADRDGKRRPHRRRVAHAEPSIRIQVSVLPAHPTVRRPSSSLSRLIRIEPVTSAGVERVRALEPDLLGDGHQQLERAVRAATRPRRAPSSPRSRPRRRRRASYRPPSASRRHARSAMRPSVGSFGLDGSRSQTMSRCPWSTTVGAASRPGVAGTRDHDVAAGVLLEARNRVSRPTRERARSPAPRDVTVARSSSAPRSAPRRNEARVPSVLLSRPPSRHTPSYASAFCLSASNSACVIAPCRGAASPCRSPRQAPPPAVSRT